ncbi:hypothetical protein [Acetonema longum]|uniref:Uncharacterized protein n=1 Tax=Acetonema longum DSM 6540 TaxID=1009370 RepID=F7NQ57_9FIRM|nr:hypothetical protein [Acetonema longum]EGO61816.1 hypothetical protein ALO_21289 [Acetonema longum DSM 6540]
MTAKRLFPSRMGSFGSLLSLTVTTFFGALYCLALPGFLTSAVGKVYAVVWAAIGLTIALAHGRQLLLGSKKKKREMAVYEMMARRPVRSKEKVYRRKFQY